MFFAGRGLVQMWKWVALLAHPVLVQHKLVKEPTQPCVGAVSGITFGIRQVRSIALVMTDHALVNPFAQIAILF